MGITPNNRRYILSLLKHCDLICHGTRTELHYPKSEIQNLRE
jgi:hypothetical protein